MSHRVDLNADMGESFGQWVMGDDRALMQVITSANIACGAHAGDPDVMAQTFAAAREHDVGVGAHPGFADLRQFGRQRQKLSETSLTNLIQYQMGAAQALAQANGVKLRHVKLHGAMGNMTSEDPKMAATCYQAVLDVCPDVILVVMAGTAQQTAAQALGAPVACEIFADRAYNDDATLVDRSLPGAVIHDAEDAARRMVAMVQAGAIITATGKEIPTRIDTICLHGDTPKAVDIARKTRVTLERSGIAVERFSGSPL